MGFQLQPLMASGGLDTSGDWKGGRHPVEEDPLYRLATENREGGNKLVKEENYEMAIAKYSELIMQTRTLENETDVDWTEDGRNLVRVLRATAYLNLSLCFLKTEQWTHASNTALRAVQGDKEPPEKKEEVLPAEKKAKALYRRAIAQTEGFGNFDVALQDLRRANDYAPEDKAVLQMLKKCEVAVAKTEKSATKKMKGFLSKATADGEGLFDESLRPSNVVPEPKKQTEPVKVKDGLWIVPEEQQEASRRAADAGDEDIVDFDELSREITEIRTEDPEAWKKLRDQVEDYVKSEVEEREKGKTIEVEEVGDEELVRRLAAGDKEAAVEVVKAVAETGPAAASAE